MFWESGVYTMQEAEDEGLMNSRRVSDKVMVFDESKREFMFSLCKDFADSEYARLSQMSGIYQNEMPITKDECNHYISMLNDIRESVTKNLDEIERLFREVCENNLIEKSVSDLR